MWRLCASAPAPAPCPPLASPPRCILSPLKLCRPGVLQMGNQHCQHCRLAGCSAWRLPTALLPCRRRHPAPAIRRCLRQSPLPLPRRRCSPCRHAAACRADLLPAAVRHHVHRPHLVAVCHPNHPGGWVGGLVGGPAHVPREAGMRLRSAPAAPAAQPGAQHAVPIAASPLHLGAPSTTAP